MSETVLRVAVMQNGFEVSCYEPPGKKKAETTSTSEYRDPWKSYAFKTLKEVVAFITKKLPTLSRMDFDEAFEEATTDDK